MLGALTARGEGRSAAASVTPGPMASLSLPNVSTVFHLL